MDDDDDDDDENYWQNIEEPTPAVAYATKPGLCM